MVGDCAVDLVSDILSLSRAGEVVWALSTCVHRFSYNFAEAKTIIGSGWHVSSYK